MIGGRNLWRTRKIRKANDVEGRPNKPQKRAKACSIGERGVAHMYHPLEVSESDRLDNADNVGCFETLENNWNWNTHVDVGVEP